MEVELAGTGPYDHGAPSQPCNHILATSAKHLWGQMLLPSTPEEIHSHLISITEGLQTCPGRAESSIFLIDLKGSLVGVRTIGSLLGTVAFSF